MIESNGYMNYFDNEEKIIECFQSVSKSEVYFPAQTGKCLKIFNSIYNKRSWKKWINNSVKSNPPPDFFTVKLSLMMEVMRVDDHAHFNEKGVLINPVNQRESIIQKEIRKKFKADNSELDLATIDIIVNASSGLPSNEDHNYHFYYSNFQRVLKKHINKIPLYRKNHPDKELIFFIFDESTGYLVADDEDLVKRGPVPLEWFKATPLCHFADERFISVFKETDIDYIVWYTPYKMFHGVEVQPPKVCVFDVNKINDDNMIQYPEKYIISSEA